MKYGQIDKAHDEAHRDHTESHVNVLDSEGVNLGWKSQQGDPGYEAGKRNVYLLFAIKF